MPFNKNFIEIASRYIDVKSVDADLQIAKDLITKAMRLVMKENPLIKTKNVNIYLHGSYANKTNIFFPSNLEVCVELKIKPFEYKLSHNYYIAHDLEFSPKDFRGLLFDALAEVTKTHCTEDDKCIILPQFGKLKHSVEIMPCMSFDYVEDDGALFKGVLLYDAGVGADIATFPKLHTQNGHTKDIKCTNFKRMVRLFKTINKINAREHGVEPARGYFIECLLFNVPDAIFRGSTTEEVFLKVMNYLVHINMEGFVCQNLVWNLFGGAREFWTETGAYKFIKSMRIMYKTFPPTRTALTLDEK